MIKLYDILLNTKSNEECGVVCVGEEDCFAVDYGDGLGRICVETEKQKQLYVETGKVLER